MQEGEQRARVDRFILDEVESVPHLEALLILWRSRPRRWTVLEMAASLYIAKDEAAAVMADLGRRGLAVASPEGYCCTAETPRLELIGKVEGVYSRELIRITRLIHSKPSSSVRAFARAFRWTRD